MTNRVILLALAASAAWAGPAAGDSHAPDGDQAFAFIITAKEVRIDLTAAGTSGANRLECYREGQEAPVFAQPLASGEPVRLAFEETGVYVLKLAGGGDQDATAYRCLVDWEPPIVELRAVDLVEGRLAIEWVAFDRHFGAQPISLYLVDDSDQRLLSRTGNGGWIRADVDPLPDGARVKVVATDLAGNATAAMSEPIVTPPRQPVATAPASQPVSQVQAEPAAKAPIEIPPDARLHHVIGSRYRASGQFRLARYHLDKAVEFCPKFVDAYVDLSAVLGLMERYNEARQACERALAIDPNHLGALEELGTLHVRQGRLVEAIDCFERLTQIDGKHVRGWLSLGDACWMAGRFDRSREAWEKARTLAAEAKSPLLAQVEKRCRMASPPAGG